jgi:four helix bundle protein
VNREELINRTKNFAISIFHLCDELTKNPVNNVCARQLIRSGSSVGSNYHAASRAKSTADFINKLKIVEEESDESVYFL